MEKMKLLATLVCAFAVLAFATPALAQNDEAAVDWDEAIEFAELTDTYVENGVDWETYYDELQGVMWSQPEGTSEEAAKAYLSGDQETLKDLGLLDICFVVWPVPNYLGFVDGASTYEFYNADFYLYQTAANSRRWVTDIGVGVGMQDIDTSVTANVRNATSYCGNYQNRGYSPGAGVNDYWVPDQSSCNTVYGVTYYGLYDTSHVENWDYSEYGYHYVSRHRFYACEQYHYVYLMVGVGPE